MIKEKAYAKLNLNLHIIPRKLKNGLYPVKFINCQINLFDELSIKPLKINIKGVTKNNLVYKAAVLLKNLAGNQVLGAGIYLKKNIPVKAGLAGGSTDAAAAITGLSKLWKMTLSQLQLNNLAEKLGKDVFYCLRGGLCQVEGDGSRIVSLDLDLPRFWLVVITPDVKKPSTEWMYNNLDIEKIGKNQLKFEKIKRAIKLKNTKDILENLHNDFESLAVKRCPEITNIKKDLINSGARNTLLAGSGFTVSGFFSSKSKAADAYKILKVKYKNIIYACTR